VKVSKSDEIVPNNYTNSHKKYTKIPFWSWSRGQWNVFFNYYSRVFLWIFVIQMAVISIIYIVNPGAQCYQTSTPSYYLVPHNILSSSSAHCRIVSQEVIDAKAQFYSSKIWLAVISIVVYVLLKFKRIVGFYKAMFDKYLKKYNNLGDDEE